MKFKRYFYDSRINFKGISVEWFLISIIIGLLSALTIYSFFYVIRESFRIMAFGNANLPYIITEKDRGLYNLFFAGLSVIFANSITISMLLSRPSNIISRSNPIRRRILNNQIFLNFNFSYWFTKMGLCFFVFSMCCMDFDFSPYVGFLSTLLLIVLYLDSWKGLIRILHKNRFKIQVIHFLVMLLLAFGLSKIDMIDYRAVDETAIQSRPIYALPHSNFYDELYNVRNNEITLNLELNDKDELLIRYCGKSASIENIPSIIGAERASIREELIPFLYVRISADKHLNIENIKKVESILYSISQQNVIYDVYNDDLLTHRFENRGIKFRITPTILEFKLDISIPHPPLSEWMYFDRSRNLRDILNIEISNDTKVSDSEILEENLIEEFKKFINKDILFEYSYKKGATYQDYINVLSAHREAVFELRQQNQKFLKKHRWDNNKDYSDEQNKLKIQFPMQLIEKFD